MKELDPKAYEVVAENFEGRRRGYQANSRLAIIYGWAKITKAAHRDGEISFKFFHLGQKIQMRI